MGPKTFELAEWIHHQWVDAAPPMPLYRQLYQLICRSILEGLLKPGDRLPSSRSLAGDLGLGRNTVIQVYEQLAVEGYVSADTGRGTYVQDLRSEAAVTPAAPYHARRVPMRLASGQLSRRGQAVIRHLGFSNQQRGAFVAGEPDIREFPVKAWVRLQNRIWRNDPGSLMPYAPAGGYLPLRVALSQYLISARSVNSTPDNVMITAGIHQGVDFAARMLCEPGDTVWIEEPSYWGVRNILLSAGMHVVGIPVDREGLALDAARRMPPPKMIIITPSHQYPMGMVMSLARRRAWLAYAREHACWIVEDDYDSEFRFMNRPLPSLQGMDDAGCVLYAGSFSKTLFPGLRVGYLVVPDSLAGAFRDGLAELYREGQLLTQALLSEFIAEGYFISHIRRMRVLYAERRQHLMNIIRRRYGSALEVIGDKAGLHMVLAMPSYVDDMGIAAECQAAGLIVRPLSDYYLGPPRRRGLLLGYASVTTAEIDAGFDVLARIIDRHLARRRLRRRDTSREHRSWA